MTLPGALPGALLEAPIEQMGGTELDAHKPAPQKRLLILLTDPDRESAFVERARHWVICPVSTDRKDLPLASCLYVDAARFDDMARDTPAGISVVFASASDVVDEVLPRLAKKVLLSNRGEP